jgi:hypothetical protein
VPRFGGKMAKISKSLSLRSRARLTRVVSFYDTESLSLFHQEPKVILRPRYDSSSESHTTVRSEGESHSSLRRVKLEGDLSV